MEVVDIDLTVPNLLGPIETSLDVGLWCRWRSGRSSYNAFRSPEHLIMFQANREKQAYQSVLCPSPLVEPGDQTIFKWYQRSIARSCDVDASSFVLRVMLLPASTSESASASLKIIREIINKGRVGDLPFRLSSHRWN